MPPLEPPEELRSWAFSNRRYQLGRFPLLMGILNVTPDSFSDGGRYLDPQAALRQAHELVEAGADILDVGGESTRPYAQPVSAEEEARRVLPVIEALAPQLRVPISIDTTKAAVARRALAAGASIVNDVSGLTFDPEMPAVCRDAQAGIVCMHLQGTPQTMQDDPRYENVVDEITAYFDQRLAKLHREGIPPERIVLDPGVGFGKTARHNVDILSHIDRFRALGRPVLIGHSRKGFLGKVLGRQVDERNFGTVGVSIALAAQSTDILRVHDVRGTRDALLAWHAILQPTNQQPPAPPSR